MRPRHLFLNVPIALLDEAVERRLFGTPSKLKRDGITIVMVLHRSGVMGWLETSVHFDQGRMADYGPRSAIVNRIAPDKRRLQLAMVPAGMGDLTAWINAQFTRADERAYA